MLFSLENTFSSNMDLYLDQIVQQGKSLAPDGLNAKDFCSQM